MGRWTWRWALGVLALVALTASDCNSNVPVATPIDAEVPIDQSLNGGQVFILLGQVLVVSLESNPGEGFTWEVNEIDTSFLRQMGVPEFQPSPGGAGGPGTQIFRFQSTRRGETDIELIYRRPFDEDAEPQDRFQVHLFIL